MKFRLMLLILVCGVVLWRTTIYTIADDDAISVDEPAIEQETIVIEENSIPIVDLVISPAEVDIDSGDDTSILVTVHNKSAVPLHNLRLDCMADASIGTCEIIHLNDFATTTDENSPSQSTAKLPIPSEIASYSSVSTIVTIKRPEGTVFDGDMIFYLQYDCGEQGQTGVVQEVVKLTHDEIKAPIEIRIDAVEETISDWMVFDVFVSIENKTDTNVTIRDFDVHIPSLRSKTGDSKQLDWRHPIKEDGTLIIAPRRTYTNWLQLSFADDKAVTPGDYLIGLGVGANWNRNGVTERSFVAVTHTIKIGVYGDETLSTLLQVPLVFIPGVVAITILIVAMKLLNQSEINLTITESAMSSIPISIGIVAAYNELTQSMVPYAYNFADVQRLLLLGVLSGVLLLFVVGLWNFHKSRIVQNTTSNTTDSD